MSSSSLQSHDPSDARLLGRIWDWADQAAEPIDAMDVARRVARTEGRDPGLRARISAWRRYAVFRATPLVALVAVVVLGTGVLFLAASQGSSPTPAAGESPSPSVRPWSPPPGLVGREYRPGVSTITNDGKGHELRFVEYPTEFEFSPDGSMWLLDSRGLILVGREGTSPGPGHGEVGHDLAVAPDGTLWALANGTVSSFQDGAWTEAPVLPGDDPARALTVVPDGTTWARSATTLARLDGDRWIAFPIDYLGTQTGSLIQDLEWTADGSLWLSTCDDDGAGSLLRFDGTAWELGPQPMTGPDVCPGILARGRDGELWVYVGSENDPTTRGIARFDGTNWTLRSEEAGIPRVAAFGAFAGRMAVGPDGRLWATAAGPALFSYDGSDVLRVPGAFGGYHTLADRSALGVAPDGTVWLVKDGGIDVITPLLLPTPSLLPAASP